MRNFLNYLLAILLLTLLMISAYIYQSAPSGSLNHSESKYHSGVVKIQQYLFHLASECKAGRFEIAQNTFLDLQHHWERQDVLFKTIKNQSGHELNYLSSESLDILEKHLNQLYLTPHHPTRTVLIIREIKKLNAKLDQMSSVRKSRSN